MSSLNSYTTLHQYVQRVAEDDLLGIESDKDCAAFIVGRIVGSLGNTIEEAAAVMHRSNDAQAVERFHLAIGAVAEQVTLLTAIVGEAVGPFGDLEDSLSSEKLSSKVNMFSGSSVDNLATIALSEANRFLNEEEKA